MANKNINEDNEDICEINDMENESNQIKDIQEKKTVKPNKKVKRGIIYLSTIPKYMNVTMLREIFSAYGEVGRVYLQLEENGILFFIVIFM
jgi:ESF2/ABP1 family protein